MLTIDYVGGGGGGLWLAVDYVIKILIFTLIPIWIFLFNSFPQWVFRISFLIKQINGFNKHALNSNESKLNNIYTFKNILNMGGGVRPWLRNIAVRGGGLGLDYGWLRRGVKMPKNGLRNMWTTPKAITPHSRKIMLFVKNRDAPPWLQNAPPPWHQPPPPPLSQKAWSTLDFIVSWKYIFGFSKSAYIFGFSKSAPTPRYTILDSRLPPCDAILLEGRLGRLSSALRGTYREWRENESDWKFS